MPYVNANKLCYFRAYSPTAAYFSGSPAGSTEATEAGPGLASSATAAGTGLTGASELATAAAGAGGGEGELSGTGSVAVSTGGLAMVACALIGIEAASFLP